jgi:hypothetical protein
MLKDNHNVIDVLRAISPVSVADNTAQVSQIIDLQGYTSLEFVILAGSLADADATFTSLVEHGDAANMSDAATPAAADLLGTAAEASFVFSDDNKVFKIGYKGAKRYVRLTITPANNASAALLAAVAVVGKAKVGTL